MPKSQNHVFRWIIAQTLGLVIFFSTPAPGASGDCQKIEPILQSTICANSELSKLDDEMNRQYAHLIADLSAHGKQILLHDQQSWIKALPNCSDLGHTDACLIDRYKSRINYITSTRRFLPYIIIEENSHIESEQNGFHQSIDGMCSVIDFPRSPEVEFANAVISGVCSPPDDVYGEALTYVVRLSYINRKIFSFEFSSGHWPTQTQTASYSGGFSTLKLNREKIVESDLFISGSNWREVVASACPKSGSDPDMMFDFGSWLFSDVGIEVTCGPQEQQNLGTGSQNIPWASIRPFMKPDAIAP